MFLAHSNLKRNGFQSVLIPVIGVSTFMLGGILVAPSANQPISAMESSHVGSSFEKAPRLSPVSAIHTGPGGPSIYTFTVTVPKDAGQSLQAVRVHQISGVYKLSFNSNQSRAYLGDRVARAQSIPLSPIGGTEESSVLIPFASAIAPGHAVTITLQVERNPSIEGIYQFGITAFPVGENQTGLYLGTKRVHYNYHR